MSVRLYLPLCCVRTVPKVSAEEDSYASHFYPWFLESFKSCLLLLVALPGLTDTLAQLLAWMSLLWLSMTWQRRYLTQKVLDNIAGLISGIKFIILFSQEKPLRWKEINTHAAYLHLISPCIQTAYGTLEQNLVKFQHTEVINLEVTVNHLDHIKWHRRCKSLIF